MKIKSNYHTHHYLCGHANGNVCDYVLEAIKNGYEELGISDHGPLPVEPPFVRMTYDEFINIYLKEIKEAKNKYNDQIKIYSALEMEYVYYHDDFYKELLTKVDYLILAGHYVTGIPGQMKGNSVHTSNTHEAIEMYASLLITAMKTKFFKILAHPDIFVSGYRRFDELAEKLTVKIVETAIENNVLLEFNCEGLRKSKVELNDGVIDYIYPHKRFWDIVSKMNAKVVIDSDCHTPENLCDEAVKEAYRLGKEYKLNIVDKIEL